jgi:hypothetical protein
MPDGGFRTLGRLVATSGEAWFSIRQASNLLDQHQEQTPFQEYCKKGELRPATPEETRVLKKAKVVTWGRAPLLASTEALQQALWQLGSSLEPPGCVHEDVRLFWDRLHVLFIVHACACGGMGADDKRQ